MQKPNASQFTASAGIVRSFRPLAAEDTARLAQFYLRLDPDQRRLRFCGTLSDGAVRRHCRLIDWKHALVVACMNSSVIEAAMEIHPLEADWRRAEIALACVSTQDRVLVTSHLLQLAAFAAGRLGCQEFLVTLDRIGCDMLPLLNGMGEVCIKDANAIVSLGDYAALNAGPPVPTMWRGSRAMNASVASRL